MTTPNSEIEIQDIEKELSGIRSSLTDGKELRACLFNLVVYSQNKKQSDYFQKIVRTVIKGFPCRVIFVKADTHPEADFLRITLTNQIQLEKNKSVPCEQINIMVSDTQLNKVPFIVLPVLVPDLPVYLLWGQDPTKDSMILPYLRNYATQLVFNSDFAENLPLFSRRILDMVDTKKIAFMDINWAAIAGWRDIIARVFDTEEKFESLKNCKTVFIQYNNYRDEIFDQVHTQAFYFQAWLASLLGWQLQTFEESEQKYKIIYNNMDHEVQICLIEQFVPELPSGNIVSFEMTSGEHQYYYFFRDPNSNKVNIQISSIESGEIPYSINIPDLRRSTAVMKEIFYQQPSGHYRKMLRKIAEMGSSGERMPILGA